MPGVPGELVAIETCDGPQATATTIDKVRKMPRKPAKRLLILPTTIRLKAVKLLN